jgi:hypothetical protein
MKKPDEITPTAHLVDNDIEYELYGLFKIPKMPAGKIGRPRQTHEEWQQLQEEKEAEQINDHFEKALDDHWNY